MTKQRRIGIAILSMLISCAMLFTACDKLSVKDVEKDPAEQLFQSTKTTATTVVNTCSPVEPLKKSLDKGTLSVELDNDEIGKIAVKLQMDAENAKSAASLSADVDGESLSLNVYAQDNKLAIESEELFDGAYGVDLATLSDDLKDSALLDLMGVTYEELEEYIGDLLEEIENFTSGTGEAEKKMNESLKELKDAIKKKLNSTEISVVVNDETDVKAIVVTYAFDGETLYDIFEIIVDWYRDYITDVPDVYGRLYDVDLDELDETLQQLLDSMKASLDESDLDITLKIALNPKTADIMRADFTMEGVVDGEEGKITAFIDLGKNPEKSEKWTAELVSEGDDEKIEMSAEITRIDNDETFTRAIELSYKEDGETEKLIAEFEHDKADKSYKASAEVDGGKVEIKGDLEYTEDSFAMTVDSIEVDGEKTEIGLKITAKAEADVPEMPEFENIFKLDSGKLEDLMLEIEENGSALAGMFGSSSADAAYPNYGYDDEYSDDYGWDDTDYDLAGIYKAFNEDYDYDLDGDVGDADDLAEFESEYLPYGVYDSDFDYDLDGDTGDSDDREMWQTVASLLGLE